MRQEGLAFTTNSAVELVNRSAAEGLLVRVPDPRASPSRWDFKCYPPAVLRIGDADEQTLRRRTVHKLNRTIVVKAKPSCRIRNVDRDALLRSGHLKQKLMLLGIQLHLLRRLFAELKEGSQLVSKLREHLQQLPFCSKRAPPGRHNISSHDIYRMDKCNW